MKILDCTLRDGGYYTSWDFGREVTEAYFRAVDELPIDYIEIGYRQKATDVYVGQYGYTPVHTVEWIKGLCHKKLAVMLNEKDTSADDVDGLVAPLTGVVDMVRVAVAPENVVRTLGLCEKLKRYGVEVAFNVMYMSKWSVMAGFYDSLKSIDGHVDVLTMVDSYGGVTPTEVAETVARLKDSVGCKLGFHGHNNLQLALANTLAALGCGVEFVDCTVLGMGRGAGNLNTELLLTFLNRDNMREEGNYGNMETLDNGAGACTVDVDFTTLGDAISAFQPLYEKYKWGTQLPYMISGANSLPQKEVMSMVMNRVYSFDSIVRGLQNRKNNITDNAKYPLLHNERYDSVLIVGGGSSPVEHLEGIYKFVRRHENVALVFATARHCAAFEKFDCPKYYCLVGREAKRLAANATQPFRDKCVLPPYPRKLGTDVPDFARDHTFELPEITFTSRYTDSCTVLAVQTALLLSPRDIYVVGYDGYAAGVYSEKEIALTSENRAIFGDVMSYRGKPVVSLTPTLYEELKVESLYGFL